MARNMSYPGKEPPRAGPTFNPVVLTSDQEEKMMLKPKVRTSKFKLYMLKDQQPHLFADTEGNLQRMRAQKMAEIARANGLQRVSPGWLFDKERQLYIEEKTERVVWYDADAGAYRLFNFAEDFSAELALAGQATTSTLSPLASNSSGSSASPSAAPPVAKSLVIMDLHKAAEIFKLDLLHVDKPAAMLAVYKHVEGAVTPEVAAQGLHSKLLRRLALYRGMWSDASLETALKEVMAAVATEHKAASGVAGVVALILGPRLIVAASHGGACAIGDALPGDIKDIRTAVSTDADGDAASTVSTACVSLDARSASCIMLHTEAIDEQLARVAASHAERGHQRAGAVALFQPASSASSSSPAISTGRAAACVHLSWPAEEEEEEVSAKRRKIDKTGASDKDRKVRCRQILLRYAGCKQPTDPVRKKPVSRSLTEAESAMLKVLSTISEASASGGVPAAESSFTEQCRAVSECTSSLRGRDLAGDIGWLEMPKLKTGEKKFTKEQMVKLPVIRAALGLAVNEVSDIIVSENGVHILIRAA